MGNWTLPVKKGGLFYRNIGKANTLPIRKTNRKARKEKNRGLAKHGTPNPLAPSALRAVKNKNTPRTQANSEAPLPPPLDIFFLYNGAVFF
ncbi:hypothetical protein TPE_2281 [Treponema pedis str. T A4]|uniref:Uncharacterized protein n=1 Tax=Treponema pedis str. T A4 TaxID=1291379 RepID=S5ZWJ1_9SPIR|nr:hypothetical protein TPE_2281 [Treponema pedis str. T A4]